MSTQYLTALIHDKCKELKKLIGKLEKQDSWDGWSKETRDGLMQKLDEVRKAAKTRLDGLIIENGAKPEDYPF